jgi:hypothetical protein
MSPLKKNDRQVIDKSRFSAGQRRGRLSKGVASKNMLWKATQLDLLDYFQEEQR